MANVKYSLTFRKYLAFETMYRYFPNSITHSQPIPLHLNLFAGSVIAILRLSTNVNVCEICSKVIIQLFTRLLPTVPCPVFMCLSILRPHERCYWCRTFVIVYNFANTMTNCIANAFHSVIRVHFNQLRLHELLAPFDFSIHLCYC